MPRDEEAITRTYTDYFAAFQSLDARGVARYCHAPCLFLSAQGVALATDAAEVERLFGTMMDGLRARGYGRSELSELRVKQLSDGMALVNITGVRYRADGEVLEPLGATYVLARGGEGWRFVLIAVHDPDVRL